MEYSADALMRAKNVKMVVFDVDGTLTDGKIYMGPQGEAMKAFSAQDGMGISLLHKSGIYTAIITGRSSQIVANRAGELKMARVYQGCADKRLAWQQLKDEYHLTDAQMAYIGDDLNDLPLLTKAGFAASVANGRREAKAVAHFVAQHDGGDGGVRDVIEFILRAQGQWTRLAESFTEVAPVNSLAQ